MNPYEAQITLVVIGIISLGGIFAVVLKYLRHDTWDIEGSIGAHILYFFGGAFLTVLFGGIAVGIILLIGKAIG